MKQKVLLPAEPVEKAQMEKSGDFASVKNQALKNRGKLPPEMSWLVLAAILSAFVGSFIGTRVMQKVTLRTIQLIVGVMLIGVGVGMATGFF